MKNKKKKVKVIGEFVVKGEQLLAILKLAESSKNRLC